MKNMITVETKWLANEIERLNKKIDMWQQLGKVLDQYRISHKPFNIHTIGEAVFGKDFREEKIPGIYTAKAKSLHNCLGQALSYLCAEKCIYEYTELSTTPCHKNGAIIYYIP